MPANRAMAHFGEVTGNDAGLRTHADQAIDAAWDDYRKKNGRKALDRYILSVAQDCSDLYVELKSKTAGKDYVFDFTEVDEIAFIDSVHTTDESAQVMGTIYADLILNQSPDFIGKLVLSYLIQ